MLLSPSIPPSPVFTFWWITAHSFQALYQLLLLSPCREADGKSLLSLLGRQWEIQTMQPLTHPPKPSSWSHRVTTIKTQTQFALLSQSISHLPGTLPCGPRKAYCEKWGFHTLWAHAWNLDTSPHVGRWLILTLQKGTTRQQVFMWEIFLKVDLYTPTGSIMSHFSTSLSTVSDFSDLLHTDKPKREINTEFNCTNLCVCSVAKSCETLWDAMDCSPPDSSVHGIFQTSILG